MVCLLVGLLVVGCCSGDGGDVGGGGIDVGVIVS